MASTVTLVACSLTLTTLIFTTRIWVRAKLVKRFRWDDWTMLLAFLIFILCCTAQIVSSNFLGINTLNDLRNNINDLVTLVKLLTYVTASYVVAYGFLKLSWAFFLLRLCAPSCFKKQRLTIIGAIIVAEVSNLIYVVHRLTTCGAWRSSSHIEQYLYSGRCVSPSAQVPAEVMQGILQAATTVIIAIAVPATFLVRSSLKTDQKMICIFLTGAAGSFDAVLSIVRVVVLAPKTEVQDVFLSRIYDKWQLMATLSTIQLAIGILAANLATLRPLYRIFAAGLHKTKTRESTQQEPSTTNDAVFRLPQSKHESRLIGFRKLPDAQVHEVRGHHRSYVSNASDQTLYDEHVEFETITV